MNSLAVYQPTADDRVPPQNLEAEVSAIGSMLTEPSVVDEVLAACEPDDYWRGDHQIIVATIKAMRRDAKSVDIPSLYEELARSGDLDRAGGLDTIRELANRFSNPANAVYHAEIVHQKALNRRVIQFARELGERGYSNLKSSDQLIQSIEQFLIDATQHRQAKEITSLADAIDREISDIHLRATGVTVGIPSGLDELDKKLGGFHPTNLIVLAARPGCGKTSLALNFAEHCSLSQGHPVLFVSQEMSSSELAGRSISSLTRIDHELIRTGKLKPDQMDRIYGVADGVRKTGKFWIVDQGGQSVADIAATARRLKNQNNLKIVIVDYIQLLDADTSKGENRQEQVAKISRGLKRLAMELKIPVVALSQLNRQVENREGGKPRLSDLRESGAIENDANVVLLLHQPDEAVNVVDCIVAKNRNGPTGEVKLTFLKNLMRFENHWEDRDGF